MPASSRLKFSFLKRGCSFTSRAPPPRHPNRSAGSLLRSCGGQGGLGDLCVSEQRAQLHQGRSARRYLRAERARLWGEALRVLLGHLLHQPLHLFPLDLLLPLLEGRLARNHLVQQAAQRPPVRAERVPLVLHHLGGCGAAVRAGSAVGQRASQAPNNNQGISSNTHMAGMPRARWGL